MKPATPLPWAYDSRNNLLVVDGLDPRDSPSAILAHMDKRDARKDAAYIAHACNAYPKLVEALKEAEGIVLGGPYQLRLRQLLRELGELE